MAIKNLLDEVSKTVSERDLKHEEKMRARASELEVKIAQTARRIAEELEDESVDVAGDVSGIRALEGDIDALVADHADILAADPVGA